MLLDSWLIFIAFSYSCLYCLLFHYILFHNILWYSIYSCIYTSFQLTQISTSQTISLTMQLLWQYFFAKSTTHDYLITRYTYLFIYFLTQDLQSSLCLYSLHLISMLCMAMFFFSSLPFDASCITHVMLSFYTLPI